MQSAANSIAITNTRGDVVWVNDAFSEMTGYRKDEIIYKNLRILKSGKHKTEFYDQLWKTILAGKVWQGEIYNQKKDGTIYPEEQTITPVFNTKNEIIYFVSVKRDITERKLAEEKEKIHFEQLIQADKMVALGTLVSGVAHEINNPNNFIMLNVPILKKTWENIIPILQEYYNTQGDFYISGNLKFSKLKDSIPELLEGILEGSSRIKNIVEELKDFARLQPALLTEEIDINEVVKTAVSLSYNLIENSTNNFSVSYGNNIPRLKGNFQRLEQVIINLLQNSCQALSDSSQGIFLETGFDKERNEIKVNVSDEGIGIDKENLKKIKDPFFTTKRNLGGTGLGLSVSSRIVLNHGGALNFKSKKGEGTTAVLTLPVK